MIDFSYKIESEENKRHSAGVSASSAKKVHEFIYHPQVIKDLPRGTAIFVNKDTGLKIKVVINMPF